MKKIFYFVLIAIVATSCKGIYIPYATNHFGAQSQVVLNQANFRVVRNVEVVVDFDNTNMRRAEAEKSAYGELLREAQLTGSQVLINVVIEEILRKGFHKHQYVAARATIIEFLDENGKPIVSESYRPTNTHTTVTAQPIKNSNTNVSVQEVETIKTQPIQPLASVKDTHKEIVFNSWGGIVFKVYNNIYKSITYTRENKLKLQRIQSVVLTYFESKGLVYPNLKKQLKNASSTEEQMNIFLSYSQEQ